MRFTHAIDTIGKGVDVVGVATIVVGPLAATVLHNIWNTPTGAKMSTINRNSTASDGQMMGMMGKPSALGKRAGGMKYPG